KLLSKHPPQRLLERFPASGDVLAERRVDEVLVAPAAGGVNLLPEPPEDVLVQANRDSGLAARHGDDRTPFSLTEVVFVFHGSRFDLAFRASHSYSTNYSICTSVHTYKVAVDPRPGSVARPALLHPH